MRMFKFASAALSSAALVGCTLITDATDRKIVDGPRDLNFSFEDLNVHRGLPLDVAVVNEDDVLQARARVILPPEQNAAKYPIVPINLHRALPPGKNRLLFYIDNNNDNLINKQPNGDALEHVWIRDVPSSGSGSFAHTFDFNPFTEDDYTALNGDLIIGMPNAADAGAAVRLCLMKLFKDTVKDSVVIHVFSSEDDREVAYFKTFPGNPTGTPEVFKGVIDAPNMYRIDVLVDGKLKNSINRSSEVGKALVVPAGSWFPANNALTNGCMAGS
jgi:hypothetical protein